MPTGRDYYQPALPTLLFSTHPQPAAAMVAGTKRLEYRRRFYQGAFQAFVYVTGRAGGVGLYVQCAPAVVASPIVLGQLGAVLQNDDPQAVRAYLGTHAKGLGIPITGVAVLTPISLVQLRVAFNNFVAPRSYVFLDRPARQAQREFFLDQPCQPLRRDEQLLAQIQTQLKK
ncbi:hypothetical protein D1831_10780 [Lactiplantibacillus garii]|uniref:ASCH domain-containing protein n=1 Tax=Lactiplantibacillus garii TaxID=2306423 RepID=A0A426D554_9LACO|nr:hypothetical protein [Lactiplantibacillus garii]RRK09785.1 hypothetical protein D1831_10780 [Lactiplantibacillus garii]